MSRLATLIALDKYSGQINGVLMGISGYHGAIVLYKPVILSSGQTQFDTTNIKVILQIKTD